MRLFALAPVVVLLALGAACNGDGAPASPVPSSSPVRTTPASETLAPTPSSTSTPNPLDGIDVVPLLLGEEAELPDDVALIVEVGCVECHCPCANGLVRVYRDPSGELRIDNLFVPSADLPPRVFFGDKGTQEQDTYISGGFEISADASEIVVAVCTRGLCGPVGGITLDNRLTLFRSVDGGITWGEFGVLEGGVYGVGPLVDEGLLLSVRDIAVEGRRYELFPGGEAVVPPSQADVTRSPLRLPDGELIWKTQDGRYLRSDGGQFLPLRDIAWINSLASQLAGEGIAVAWTSGQSDGESRRRYLGVAQDGQLSSVVVSDWAASVGGWIDSARVIGNIFFVEGESEVSPLDWRPAIFDLSTGTAHPIAIPNTYSEFTDPHPGIARHITVVHGPFARVVDTGSCLNVRAEPGTAAQLLECAADGVLLRDTGETRDIAGDTWLRVVTPAGTEGWASTKFLER